MAAPSDLSVNERPRGGWLPPEEMRVLLMKTSMTVRLRSCEGMGIGSLAAGIAKIQGKWRPRALLFLRTDQETWKLRGSGAERAPSKNLNAASKLTQRKLRTTNRHTLGIHLVSPRFGGLPVFISWGFQWRLCRCWCRQSS